MNKNLDYLVNFFIEFRRFFNKTLGQSFIFYSLFSLTHHPTTYVLEV